jgi:exodeoxyribonuclease III
LFPPGGAAARRPRWGTGRSPPDRGDAGRAAGQCLAAGRRGVPPRRRTLPADLPTVLPTMRRAAGRASPPPAHAVWCVAMKLATWNVNSIRARQDRLLDWLRSAAPDAVCLQETKVDDAGFPFDALQAAGYHAVTLGQRTYNGVAILSRRPATDVMRGFGDDVDDEQARTIAATVDGVRVISVYVPNGQEVGSDKYAYKLAWLARLRTYLQRHADPARPLALCGDMNVAPEDRDVYDPVAWGPGVLCSPPERSGLANVLAWGLVDVFRRHHSEGGMFSWWDYRGISLFKNLGLRIDHIFATHALAERSLGCEIDRAARKGHNASDHAPVVAEFAAAAEATE